MSSLRTPPRTHGGPDARGPARWDFSTNANACGPCPQALAAVHSADATRYPDPQYRHLRDALAELHQVDPARVVMAASASEFIMRITAVSGDGAVSVPPRAYGDYAAAAQAFNRPVLPAGAAAARATLVWAADPGSPLGQDGPVVRLAADSITTLVLDRAYAPLRLSGVSDWQAADLDTAFQLFTPNKALGLTGVRGAYAIAPRLLTAPVNHLVARLNAACPSWPVGAHGVALLHAWAEPAVQQWVADSREQLALWKHRQVEALKALGFEIRDSVVPFFCLRPPLRLREASLGERLRSEGIAWRDATSFGLPGWWRVSVQAPAAQDVLMAHLHYALECAP